jgi:hypothetical protein
MKIQEAGSFVMNADSRENMMCITGDKSDIQTGFIQNKDLDANTVPTLSA